MNNRNSFDTTKHIGNLLRNRITDFFQTGEMEVKNPLFPDDPTPATPSMRKEADDEEEEEEEQKAK